VGFSITFNDGTPADDGFKVTGDQWINHPDIDEQPIAYRVVEPPSTLNLDIQVRRNTPSQDCTITNATPPAGAAAALYQYLPRPSTAPLDITSNDEACMRAQINNNAAAAANHVPAYAVRLMDAVPCLAISNGANDTLDNDGDGLTDGADPATPFIPATATSAAIAAVPADGLSVNPVSDCNERVVTITGNPDFVSYGIGNSDTLAYEASLTSGIAAGSATNVDHAILWQSLPLTTPAGALSLAVAPGEIDAVDGARLYRDSATSVLATPPPVFVIDFLPGLSIVDAVDHTGCSEIERQVPEPAKVNLIPGNTNSPLIFPVCNGLGTPSRNVQRAAIGEEIELRFVAGLPIASYANLTFGIDLPPDMSCVGVNTSNSAGNRSRGVQTFMLPEAFFGAPAATPTVTCAGRTIRWAYGDQVNSDTGPGTASIVLRAIVAIDNRVENATTGALANLYSIGNDDAFVRFGEGANVQTFTLGSPVLIRRDNEPALLFAEKTWLAEDGTTPLTANADGIISAQGGDELTVRVDFRQPTAPQSWNLRLIDTLDDIRRGTADQLSYVENSLSYCGDNPATGTVLPVVSRANGDLIFTWPYTRGSTNQIYPADSAAAVTANQTYAFCYRLEVATLNQPNQLLTDSFDDVGIAVEQTSRLQWSSVSTNAGLRAYIADPATNPTPATRTGFAPKDFGDVNGPRNYEQLPTDQDDPAQFLPPVISLPRLTLSKTAFNNSTDATTADCATTPSIGDYQCFRLTITGPRSTIASLTLSDIVAPLVGGEVRLVGVTDPVPNYTWLSTTPPAVGTIGLTHFPNDNTLLWRLPNGGGNVVIDQDSDTNEVLSLIYRARLPNLPALQGGVLINTGAASAEYNDGADRDLAAGATIPRLTATASATDPIPVHEPQINLGETVTNMTRAVGIGSGDNFNVEITLTAPAMVGAVPGSTAYDTVAYTRLPEEFAYVANSVTATLSNAGVDTPLPVTATVADNILRIGTSDTGVGEIDIPAGAVVTLNFRLVVGGTLRPLQMVEIQNGVVWSSRDGSGVALAERTSANCLVGTPVFPTAPQAGQLNDYCALLPVIELSAGDRTRIATTVIDSYAPGGVGDDDGIVRIGDLIEFSTTVRVSEGLTPSMQFVVNLPAGLNFVNAGAADYGVSFANAVGDAITTVTPARTTYAAEGPPATNARNWTLNFGDVTNTDTDPAT
ncbi:MAG: hypothetical protein K8963_02680, partial [Proteobacteria bacterium]|nr:hypothetical protein [Pseudomonadota bacterium]